MMMTMQIVEQLGGRLCASTWMWQRAWLRMASSASQTTWFGDDVENESWEMFWAGGGDGVYFNSCHAPLLLALVCLLAQVAAP